MRDTRFDTRSSEWMGDMTVWLRANASDNAEQMERLTKNLRVAIQEELSPRQREMIVLYFLQNRTMPQIAQDLGVNRSTVCRTIQRGKSRLRKVLQYSF